MLDFFICILNLLILIKTGIFILVTSHFLTDEVKNYLTYRKNNDII